VLSQRTDAARRAFNRADALVSLAQGICAAIGAIVGHLVAADGLPGEERGSPVACGEDVELRGIAFPLEADLGSAESEARQAGDPRARVPRRRRGPPSRSDRT
jgi:hypothetical protein